MSLLIQVLAFVITILLLVSIHEAGHFFVAKLLGIKVTRYSIGFGKALFRYRSKAGTEYILALIPLGGYVKLLDEREAKVSEAEKPFAFNRQPIWARTLVVLAGPATNFLFAIAAFWVMFASGIQVYSPIIGSLTPHSIAANSGLQPGDEITSINQKATPSLQKVVMRLVEHLGDTGPLIVTTQNIYSHKTAVHSLDIKHWTIDQLNPDPLDSLGIVPIRPQIPAVIGGTNSEGPAARYGLKEKDHILAVNGQPVNDWYGLVSYIRKHPDQKISLLLERNKVRQTLIVVTSKQPGSGSQAVGYLGVKPLTVTTPSVMIKLRKYPVGQALGVAVHETWQFIEFNYVVIAKMVVGKISLSTLGGPIAIFQTADQAFEQGVGVFFGFLALLSVMLGFINLLPIPGLDGGHLLNFLIEFAIRRPLSLQFELLTIRIGLLILIAFMVIATINDIMRVIASL